MDRYHFKLAYDGPALRKHLIDASDLAPALLALSELLKETNRELNGERTDLTVYVGADFTPACFEINFEIVIQALSLAQAALDNPQIKTVKELLEWLDLLDGTIFGLGFLGWLRMRKNKKIVARKRLRAKGKPSDAIEITLSTGEKVVLREPVLRLSENKKAVASVSALVKPLENDGYEEMRTSGDGAKPVTISKQNAADIRMACLSEQNDIQPQTVVAHLEVYKPTLDAKSKVWKFRYDGAAKDVDISESTIARDTIARGGVKVGDTYEVKLEVTEEATKRGFRNKYKIKEVLDFFNSPPSTQLSLIAPQPRSTPRRMLDFS